MNVEIVAQMFKNYQSNVLFNLEGRLSRAPVCLRGGGGRVDGCANVMMGSDE